MFEEAVEAGIAAFRAGPDDPSDDEVRDRLRTAGVAEWLAERLIVFLPLAMGRRVLAGVTLSDSFSDGGRLRPLAEEPVYAAAVARTAWADRAEVARIGLRSSEVGAVNNALNNGSRMADLQVGPAVLAQALPPVGDDDGGVPSLSAVFAGFLAGHGFPVDGNRTGELRFGARLFPHPQPRPGLLMAQADFTVAHPALAGDRLVESVAGTGTTWREVIGQCAALFERASLHPVIAVLIDRSAAADQVSWERYAHPGGDFDVCLGPQINRFAPAGVPPMGQLVDDLLTVLRDVPLSRKVHWLRVFTYHQGGALVTNEVLLDNEPWAAGEAVVAAGAPPLTDGMVARRVFGLLAPVSSVRR